VGRVTSLLFGRWRRLHLGRPSLSHLRYVDTPVSVPDRLRPREFVVVGSSEFPKWAVFDCPCGRGHRLMLSLQRSHRPHWRLELDPHGPSLWPSVDSRTGYRCHFWVREGHVHWVPAWAWESAGDRPEEREEGSPPRADAPPRR
jgi:hypothetical protein